MYRVSERCLRVRCLCTAYALRFALCALGIPYALRPTISITNRNAPLPTAFRSRLVSLLECRNALLLDPRVVLQTDHGQPDQCRSLAGPSGRTRSDLGSRRRRGRVERRELNLALCVDAEREGPAHTRGKGGGKEDVRRAVGQRLEVELDLPYMGGVVRRLTMKRAARGEASP